MILKVETNLLLTFEDKRVYLIYFWFFNFMLMSFFKKKKNIHTYSGYFQCLFFFSHSSSQFSKWWWWMSSKSFKNMTQILLKKIFCWAQVQSSLFFMMIFNEIDKIFIYETRWQKQWQSWCNGNFPNFHLNLHMHFIIELMTIWRLIIFIELYQHCMGPIAWKEIKFKKNFE